jgi:hypothetical protein
VVCLIVLSNGYLSVCAIRDPLDRKYNPTTGKVKPTTHDQKSASM